MVNLNTPRAGQAVTNYRTWQRSKLGRAIDPSELNKLVKNAGAKRVEITLPVYTAIEKYQFAAEETVTVNYGGLEDD